MDGVRRNPVVLVVHSLFQNPLNLGFSPVPEGFNHIGPYPVVALQQEARR